MTRITPVVKYLVIVNVALFLLQWLILRSTNYDIQQVLALRFGQPDGFMFFQFFTYMFMHSYELGHVLFNMLALWIFGSQVEQVMGQKRFFFYYITCGIGAAIIHILAEYFYSGFHIPVISMVGASGSVYGIILAFAFLCPNLEMFMFPIFRIKAKYVAVIAIVSELVMAHRFIPGDSVAHFAHLGGMLVGYILLKRWGLRALY